nr:hypothetical protein [Sinorhizobium meliloti]
MNGIIFQAVLLSVTVLLSAFAAWAGPFGIEQGQSKDSLRIFHEPSHYGVYKLCTVPRRHPAFEVYSAEISETVGVCRVNAGSVMFTADRLGTKVRAKFDEIVRELEDIYGQGKDFKSLKEGSRWSEKRDWVMSVTENERTYRREWSVAYGSRLKDGISRINLAVHGLGEDVSFIALEYAFENYTQCLSEKAQSTASAL